MHELSIAKAILNSLDAHTPCGSAVSQVHVSVGPLLAIEPRAMQFAWRAATEQTTHNRVSLRLHMLPYRWHCTPCGRRWDSSELFGPCACGNPRPDWVGGDELTIDSLEVEMDRSMI